MDVKDVNTASNLPQAGRNNASALGNVMIGDAFSSLLSNKKAPAELSEAGSKFAIKDSAQKYVVKPSDSNKTSVENKKTKDKASVEVSTSDDAGKPKIKADKEVSEKDNKVNQDKEDGSIKDTSVDDQEVDDTSSEGIDVENAVLYTSIPQNVFASFETSVVPAQVSSLSVSSSAPVVSDPLIASEVQASPDMTVEIPVVNQKLEQGKASFQGSDKGIDLSALGLTENVADVEIPQILAQVQSAESIVPMVKNTKASSKTTDVASLADATAESSSVAEVANDGMVSAEELNLPKTIKAEVKVNSDEEKFAYQRTNDLLADVKTVDEAVSFAKATDAGAPKAKTSDVSGTLSQQASAQVQNNSINPNQALNVMVDPSAVLKQATDSSEAAVKLEASVSDVKGLNLAQAASGSEFVNSAKLNSAAEAKSSVSDVYKGMSREVIDQIKVNITKSAVKGLDKIDIQLKPEDLGHIEIKMQISKNGKLQAEIMASRPETMELLQKDVQSLQKAFNDAGFQTDENSLSFSYRDDSQANQQQERNPEMRKFMGDMLDNDYINDNAADYSEQNWGGQSGLNIKV